MNDNDHLNAWRLYTDLAVSLFHILFVSIIYGTDSGFLDTVQGKLILVLEITTIVFHLAYVGLYYRSNRKSTYESGHVKFQTQFNPWKWLVSKRCSFHDRVLSNHYNQ